MNIAVVRNRLCRLVTGTCFAETGIKLCGIDIDREIVEKLSSGEITFMNLGLNSFLVEIFIRGGSHSQLTSQKELPGPKIIFLALPTPPGEDGSADLKYILGVAEDLGPLLKEYTVIVDKSTVPVGTAERVKQKISAKAKVDFDVVSNPEFLREGVAVDDFMKPERVVIGTSSDRAKKVMETLYAPFVRPRQSIGFLWTRNLRSLQKYAANSFLATKITFMNEIANLCELLGADVDAVRKGIGTDSRIGKRFLFPGIGYGGSCFPKDVQALAKSSDDANYNFKILDAVMEVNASQKNKIDCQDDGVF